MDGIIEGKHAHAYERNRYSKLKSNTFISREIKPNSVVADFCCGTGVSIEFLIPKAKLIYGIDASKDMIDICKGKFNNNPKVRLIQADVSNTGLNNQYFDYVLIRMGLHHIKDKKSVIDEAYRLLKTNGKLIIIDKFRKYNTLITYAFDLFRNILRGYHLFGHYYIRIAQLEDLLNSKFQIKSQSIQSKQIFLKANIILKKTV